MSINGRTMVPLRFVAENLGASVVWNSSTQEETIISNGGGVRTNNHQSGSELDSWDYIVVNDISESLSHNKG